MSSAACSASTRGPRSRATAGSGRRARTRRARRCPAARPPRGSAQRGGGEALAKVAPKLVGAQVDVVVGEHRRDSIRLARRATARRRADRAGSSPSGSPRGAATTRTRPPWRSTSAASSVAFATISRRAAKARARALSAKDLRRLDRPQPRALERAQDDVVIVRLLDGVAHGARQRSPHRLLKPGEHRLDQRAGDERSCRVVDEDRVAVVGRDGGEARCAPTRCDRPAGHARRTGRRVTPRRVARRRSHRSWDGTQRG